MSTPTKSQPRKLSLRRTLLFTVVGIVLAIILVLTTVAQRCANNIRRLSRKHPH